MHRRIRHLQSGKARKWECGFDIRIGCVHWFSQSVFFFIIKPRNKKKEGKKLWERKRNKKEGTNDNDRGKYRKKRKEKKKKGKKKKKGEVNNTKGE